MNADSGTSIPARDTSPPIRSDWRAGPRSDSWDRLWRTILSDIGPLPIADARRPLEIEVGDA
jgi:hypothetical protein